MATDGGYTKDEAWDLQQQAKIARLESALRSCEATFRDYERQHLAKSPPDTVKAARNRAMAEMISAELE